MLAPAGDIISTGGPENRGFAPLTNVVAPAGSQSGSTTIYIRNGICKQGAPSSSGVGRLRATCTEVPVEEEGIASMVQVLLAVLTARGLTLSLYTDWNRPREAFEGSTRLTN
jgi:hypothetical protein